MKPRLRLSIRLTPTTVIYLRTEPEVMDFTSYESGKIIHRRCRQAGGYRSRSQATSSTFIGFLQTSIFDKENCGTLCLPGISSLSSATFAIFTQKSDYADLQHHRSSRHRKLLWALEKRLQKISAEAVNRAKVIAADTGVAKTVQGFTSTSHDESSPSD
jgi:hypothetical protein